MTQLIIKNHKALPCKPLNYHKFNYTPNNMYQYFPSEQTHMQSQQIKFHIFLSHISFTMHFPSLTKSWIKYIHTEKLLQHDMQLHQTVDLEI